MSNINSIIEGLNEAKEEKKVLSDFKKGDLVQVFGHKCDYIIKSAGKKSYKLEAINPEKRDAIEIKYFNPNNKEVFLSTDNKYVITEGKQKGQVYRGLRIVKKDDGTFAIWDKLDQEVDSGHKNIRSAKKAIDQEIDTWGEDDAFGGVIIIEELDENVNKKISISKLKKLIPRALDSGKGGKSGEWSIQVGGYDKWYEVYCNNEPILGVIDGEVEVYRDEYKEYAKVFSEISGYPLMK